MTKYNYTYTLNLNEEILLSVEAQSSEKAAEIATATLCDIVSSTTFLADNVNVTHTCVKVKSEESYNPLTTQQESSRDTSNSGYTSMASLLQQAQEESTPSNTYNHNRYNRLT